MVAWDSIETIAKNVANGSISAVSLVEKAHAAIAESTDYNAIISVISERAMERAKSIDADVAAGNATGRLLGVPFIAKDNYLAFGSPTTAASNMLKDFDAPYQAEVIEKLEAEGAILVAKANLDAFAHGGSTENSDFGVTKNPVDPTRVAGGSSGGSAAAVALGLAPFALGTDTGGSIRQPASFCGVVGVKPTYGLSSRYGVISMASSTDVVGPLASSVADAALVLDCMAGQSVLDATTITKPEGSLNAFDANPESITVGVISQHMADGVDASVTTAITAAVAQLKEKGVTVREISMPTIDQALAVYYVVMPAEVSSNLGRFDGIRYGHQTQTATGLQEVYSQSRAEGFNAEVKRRILIGNYVLSSGYYDAYYKKAQQVRTLLINEFNEALSQVDVLIGPVAPTPAFGIGQNTEEPLQMYLADIMTVGMSLVGVPAVSVPLPVGDGLPIGMQITGAQGADKLVLSVARMVEGASV